MGITIQIWIRTIGHRHLDV